MKTFLKLKHWQLFLLVIICGSWVSPSPLQEMVKSIGILTSLCWSYAVGVYGHERVVALGLAPMNIQRFKTNIIALGIIILSLLALHEYLPDTEKSAFELKDIPLIILGFYFIYALVQTVLFIPKVLAKIELKREVVAADYMRYFFMQVFFFVGIWILQPKINRIFSEEDML